jgi:hypothetical protein
MVFMQELNKAMLGIATETRREKRREKRRPETMVGAHRNQASELDFLEPDLAVVRFQGPQRHGVDALEVVC